MDEDERVAADYHGGEREERGGCEGRAVTGREEDRWRKEGA